MRRGGLRNFIGGVFEKIGGRWPPLQFNATRYRLLFVIRSFRSVEAEAIFNLRHSRRLPQDMQQVALRKLRMLNRAVSLDDLRIPPANRLEKLVGDRAGQWSIRIND